MARYIDVEPLIEALETDTDRLKIKESIYAKGFDGAVATILGILRAFPTADVVEIPKGNIGNLSDGYHTFNELYHHRAILFSVICNSMPDKAWKSKLHDTGDMYEGMFIVGIETPEGQATYHYDIEPYWDLFKVKELEKAPKYDGHTPQEAIDRISNLSANVAPMEEVERLHATCTELTQCCTKLETLYKIECKRVDTVKADTIKKMQELIKERCIEGGIYPAFVASTIDQIAKEMLGKPQ